MIRYFFIGLSVFLFSGILELKASDLSVQPSSIPISYGIDSLQFGELWLPNEFRPNYPVLVLIHGGCWRSRYDLSLMDDMATDLSQRGFVVWNIEYRRTEDKGGGWPGTFTDVGNAIKHLIQIGNKYDFDLDNIILSGHSAGGHLALWLAGMNNMSTEDPLYISDMPQISGVVSLAGIVDLTTYYAPTGCGDNTVKLLGGLPEEQSDRYHKASPINRLPLGIPQILITGQSDDIVTISHVDPYFAKAKKLNESISHKKLEGVDHFDVIDPSSSAWPVILDSFREFIRK